MIGFFSDPYPDELLYSACARYTKRTKYLNKKAAVIELLGKRGFSAVWDFPTRLMQFISTLPEGHTYSVDQLITDNTLFPFYQCFLPLERARLVREEMIQDTDNRIQMRLGTRIKQIQNLDFLRYCPDCLTDDRELYGETYWHRIHQLGGILVCADHQCFLENSNLKLGRISSSYFHDAESFLPFSVPNSKKINLQNASHKIFYKTACDARWLLSQGNIKIGSEIIRKRYFNTLLEKGYAYYNGRLKFTKLQKDCQNFFPSGIFETIGRITKNKNWIVVLTRESNSRITYHPIRHLLLLTFLGKSVEEFFEDFKEYKPFGDPPYPCLNPASDHHKKLRIQKCEILDNISKEKEKQGKPIGIFHCDCGYMYQRLGPDLKYEDRFLYSSVKEYGKIWEDTLSELWADTSLSLTTIGKLLGISSTSVGRQAIRLDLTMNTNTTRNLQGYRRHRNPNKSFSELKNGYRKDWLKLREKNPNLTRKQLAVKNNFLSLWLSRNDAEWLEDNLPPQVTARKSKDILDWKDIDKNLSKKIKKICKEILLEDELPVRVCITEIIKRSGDGVWIEKRHKKLPLTTKIIDNYLETFEAYILRKIEIITKKYIKEVNIPTIPQFKARAVIVNKTAKGSVKIQKAVEEALVKIENSIHRF